MEALGTSNGAPTLILDGFSSLGVSTSEIGETGVVVIVDTGEAPLEPTATAWMHGPAAGLTRACTRAAGIGRKLRGVWPGLDTTDPPGS
mmetsp:Transcript_934/g.1472  ORF Transcript_934/g.1472 Transcript_934/m.1472 type:complete len:89 (-) Transcript_934:252-518(-)